MSSSSSQTELKVAIGTSTRTLGLPLGKVPNFKNRSLWTADCLDVLRGMDSRVVDLIYLDPPFNSDRDYNAPIASKAKGAAFSDTWDLTDVKEEWTERIEAADAALYHTVIGAGHSHSPSMQAYLTYMAVRLIEMHRVLADNGSLYLHCDPHASHYLKQLLDCLFGVKNFRNEIVWCYRGGGVPKRDFARKHDTIFRYSKTREITFNRQFVPYSEASRRLVEARGGVSIDNRERDLDRGAAMPDWWQDINSLQTWSPERTGYPTQKPMALLERIIEASSDPGGMVFDPFCGCATACVAAEKLNRRWVGVDIEPLARDIVRQRLQQQVDDGALLKPDGGAAGMPTLPERPRLPKRTDPDIEIRSRNIKPVLYKQQKGICPGCLRRPDEDWMEVDHIVPRGDGGEDVDRNLQLLCTSCNGVKGNRTMKYLWRRLRDLGRLQHDPSAVAAVDRQEQ